MNSESGPEAQAPEPGPSALDLLQRWKQMNSERDRPRPEDDQLP